MHCSSCVWLLEQLHRLDSGIVHSGVDFLKKTLSVRYRRSDTTLRGVVELLARLGYEPELRLDALDRTHQKVNPDRPLYYRIGIAGFCSANIMLFSFPEYLSGSTLDPSMRGMFGWMNLALALPVLLYSASGYFASALAGLRHRLLNIDVPIALGIAILFLRSLIDIVTASGPGFLDSMTGLIFLLLLGRLFQNKTYASLNFDRTFTSYFPLAVTVRKREGEVTTPVVDLHPGDRLVLRHGEILPADAVVMSQEAVIDYSFVTGESRPVELHTGDRVYAGAKIAGAMTDVETVKEVSEGYLTHLWSEHHRGPQEERRLSVLADRVSAYFTLGLLITSAAVAAFWLPRDPIRALDAVTAVLIVACPCALALATPFAFGTAMRIMGTKGLYLRSARVVEDLARISHIVFDKTGTISHAGAGLVGFSGLPLEAGERRQLASLVRNSLHPHSRAILDSLPAAAPAAVTGFEEVPGQGIAGSVDGVPVRLGTRRYAAPESAVTNDRGNVPGSSEVTLAVRGIVRGVFTLSHAYREQAGVVLRRLQRRFPLTLLSGDTGGERSRLQTLFDGWSAMLFEQSPEQKRDVIRSLQQQGARVMMVGDGLNDAGALLQSDAGIAVCENPGAFSPASDGILDGGAFHRLEAFLSFSAAAVRVVVLGFGISLLYNAAGLYFAVQGTLSPLIAAILMPLSSMTVVAVAAAGVRRAGRRRELC
jgi:Cu+-exporting ATPase